MDYEKDLAITPMRVNQLLLFFFPLQSHTQSHRAASFVRAGFDLRSDRNGSPSCVSREGDVSWEVKQNLANRFETWDIFDDWIL